MTREPRDIFVHRLYDRAVKKKPAPARSYQDGFLEGALCMAVFLTLSLALLVWIR